MRGIRHLGERMKCILTEFGTHYRNRFGIVVNYKERSRNVSDHVWHDSCCDSRVPRIDHFGYRTSDIAFPTLYFPIDARTVGENSTPELNLIGNCDIVPQNFQKSLTITMYKVSSSPNLYLIMKESITPQHVYQKPPH